MLTVVRSIMNWFATRHDDYQPPIIKGMRRQNPKEQVRERILTDDEMREVWKAAEANGTFGAFVRVALLTAQRRAKVMTMRWDDIQRRWRMDDPAGEAREGFRRKPDATADRARHHPRAARLGENPFVFASARTDGPITGLAMMKRDFDARLSGVAHWTIHDLRRTAR